MKKKQKKENIWNQKFKTKLNIRDQNEVSIIILTNTLIRKIFETNTIVLVKFEQNYYKNSQKS